MGKRGNGEGSIFKLKNGKWRVEISAGRKPDGSRNRPYRITRTRAEAVVELKNLQEEFAAGRLTGRRQTLGQYLAAWLRDDIEGVKADNTYDSYRLAVEKHITPHIGRTQLDELNAMHVKSLLAKLKDVGSRTRENAYVVLNIALGEATRIGLIRANPCSVVARPTHEPKEMFPFTAEEAEHLLATAQDSRFFALYVLALTTGMREGELFGLHRESVDLKNATIKIERQLIYTRGKLSFDTPKTEAGRRTVDLTPRAAKAMGDHFARLLKEGHAGCPLVFPGLRGKPLRPSNFARNHWQPLLKKAGLKPRGLHNTRHTFVILALAAGLAVNEVAAIVGHSDPGFTLRTYGKWLQRPHILAAMTKYRAVLG